VRAAAAKLEDHDRPLIKDRRETVPNRVERLCVDRSPLWLNIKIDLEPLRDVGLGFRQQLLKQRAFVPMMIGDWASFACSFKDRIRRRNNPELAPMVISDRGRERR